MAKPLKIAVILAGGHSQRMTKDKASLIRFNQSMLAFTHELLAQLPLDVILVSANKNYDTQLPIVHDIVKNKGPLGGMHASMNFILKEYGEAECLFVPIDLPLLTPDVIFNLLQVLENDTQSACYDSHPIPCVIKATQSRLEHLNHILHEAKNLSIFRFLQQLPHRLIPAPNNLSLTNTNTPAEWETALKQLN